MTHLYHSQLRCQLSSSPPPHKGNRVEWSGEDLSHWYHLYLSANFQNNQYENGEYGEGVG
jgi:hypothetical protein